MPILVISIDGAVLREVRLTKVHTTLGRRPYNDIVLDNPAVSGEHAVLTRANGSVTIEDLRSTNGTHVNGQTIQRCTLQHGDLLDIGRYKIRFLDQAPGKTPRPSPLAATLQVMASMAAAITEGKASARKPASAGPGDMPTTLQYGASLPAPQRATLRMLSGSLAGQEVTLHKVVTTLGKPGVAVASITQKPHGFVLMQVEGEASALQLNGQTVGPLPVPLQHGDTLELAGTRMQFAALE